MSESEILANAGELTIDLPNFYLVCEQLARADKDPEKQSIQTGRETCLARKEIDQISFVPDFNIHRAKIDPFDPGDESFFQFRVV